MSDKLPTSRPRRGAASKKVHSGDIEQPKPSGGGMKRAPSEELEEAPTQAPAQKKFRKAAAPDADMELEAASPPPRRKASQKAPSPRAERPQPQGGGMKREPSEELEEEPTQPRTQKKPRKKEQEPNQELHDDAGMPEDDLPDRGPSRKTETASPRSSRGLKKQKQSAEEEASLSDSGEQEKSPALPSKQEAQKKVRPLAPRQKPITYKGTGQKDGRRTTTEVLEDASKKRVRIIQFGGAMGNTAGDAALTSLKDSRRRAATDLGNEIPQQGAFTSTLEMFQKADPVDSVHSDAEEASSSEEDSTPLSKEKKPKISEDKKSKQLIIITHWHKDHSGPAVLWEVGGKKNIASAIKSKSEKDKNPTLVHGQRSPEGAPERSGTLAAELPQHQVKENGEKIYAWKTTPGKNKRDEPKPGELRVEGRAIVPPQLGELKSTAQNTESLGVITVVEKYNATNKKERLFTMVSLGDMEGGTTKRDEEIQTLITEAQERFSSGVPVDVVKISHHGSDKNLKVIPDDLIGKGTTVVISGYTGKASGPLIKKIQEWKKKKAKDVIVLVQDGATVGKLEDMEVAWTNLKPLVTVAKDLIVTADDDGSVVVEATHV